MQPSRPSGDTMSTDTRVGLVLGGGGSVGVAYHAGALAALEHDLGWDPRCGRARRHVSRVGRRARCLRRGVAATDLAAFTVGAGVLHSDPSVMQALASRPSFPPVTLRHLLRLPRIPTPGAIAGLARLSAKQRGVPFAALSTLMMPEGREVLSPHLTFLDAEQGWPEERLLVCAVRRKDLRRVVFGATTPTPALSLAVAASCAVPGYFADVDIEGDGYVDGGVVSATNADVLSSYDVDLAIVISPMTGVGGSPASQLIR